MVHGLMAFIGASLFSIVKKQIIINSTRHSHNFIMYRPLTSIKRNVLKIVCEVRKGPLCFTMCIRKALAKHFGDDIIAMGGVIIMENGKVRVHLIRPGLAKKPLESDKDISNILRFFELSPPLVGLGCIVSHDPGLNLRLEHFHLYNDSGLGGHYYYDTEPDTIKYTGYFSVAKQLTKVDQTK